MLPELDSKEFYEYLVRLTQKTSPIRHSNFNDAVDHALDMAVHAWGAMPDKILSDYRPREEEVVRKYRIESYQPITVSKFDKAVSILTKIFNPKLYSINFPEPKNKLIAEQDGLKEYTMSAFPYFDSVFMYTREVLLKSMIADPNAVIAIVPESTAVEQTELVRPIPVIFSSTQVLDFKNGEYYLLLDTEKTKYKDREGAIVHLFLANEIRTFHEKFNEKGQSYFVALDPFVHNIGYVPCWHLGGIVEGKRWPYYYKSFFNAAVPYWNKAIRHSSDLDAAYVNHLFPQKWEYTVECDDQTCDSGLSYDERLERKVPCKRCHGTGRIRSTGPYDVMQVQTQKFAEGNQIIPPGGYLTVPIDIINVLKETVKENISSGLSAINMDIVDSIGANQSGVAKEYDRSELYSFMQQISDYVFDNHLPNIFFFINRYRYSTVLGNKVDDQLPSISKPTQFDILTVKELTTEIAEAKTAKMNPMIISTMEKDYIGKKFSTNSTLQDTITIILDLDPFPNYTIDEKMAMMADGTATKEDVIISNNIKKFVHRAIEENSNFFEMPYSEKLTILKSYALELTPNNSFTATMSLSEGGIDTPVDIEAEAKAKLKGSVGGVQGILEIQKQVSEGITTYQAGLAILDLIYGIGVEEGKRILGDEDSIIKGIQTKSQINAESRQAS